MTTLLPNPAFLGRLIERIQAAKKEIVLVNYLATLREGCKRGPVASIVSELVTAARRGVVVRVVLEGTKLSENYNFYRALKSVGADVWMDTSLTFIHEKAVLIDGRWLVVGSQNITDSALATHEELALETGDARAIAAFGRELAKITAQRREIGDLPRDGVMLPAFVIVALTAIKRSLATIPYLVYLKICSADGGRPRAIATDPSWIRELGIEKSVASDALRLREALEFLDGKLKLVKFDRKKGTVTRFPIKASAASTILLPEAFWIYGWQSRLSAPAIHLYLAGEAEKIESPFAPWWRKKRDDIARRYGFQKQLVNRSGQELQRFGLLEVLYETASSVHQKYIRYSNLFRQNPFYDYDARMARIAAIGASTRPSIFKQAKMLASVVWQDSDADGIAALCARIEGAGLARAKKALKEIDSLAANSTKRTLEYELEILSDQ